MDGMTRALEALLWTAIVLLTLWLVVAVTLWAIVQVYGATFGA